MNIQQQLWQGFIICVSAVFTQNILLSYFLGLCPFIGISREVKASIGLGTAVVFVMTFTSGLNWLAYVYILEPFGLYSFRFILFIIIIAAFVQFVEMLIDRFSPPLYQKLGIFLPLITVNCAILGASLFLIIRQYNFISAVCYGFGSGLGWLMAITAMAGIRQRLVNEKIPPALRGAGITIFIAGIMALAFIGWTGVLQGR